jgi:O-antigen ligase
MLKVINGSGLKIANHFIIAAIFGVFFLVPIFFAFFPSGANVFELPKLALFRVLTIFLLLATAIRWKQLGPDLSKFDFGAHFKKYWLWMFCLIVLAGIQTVFSTDIRQSFEGSYSRQHGFLAIMHFGLFYGLLLLNLDGKKKINLILSAVSSASFLVSFYGLAQRAGFDFWSWNEPAIETGRISSTLGQPNFLGLYLIIALPLVFRQLLAARKNIFKFIFAIIFAVDLAALYFTYSRSAWIGLLIGVAFSLSAVWFWQKARIAGKIFAISRRGKIFLALILLGVAVLAVGQTKRLYKHDASFRWRVKQIANFSTGSGSARLHYWQTALDAIKAKPLGGFGLENQDQAFARGYQPEWAKFIRVGDYPDRAHNIILDALLTGGIFGLIAFFIVYVYFFKTLFANIKDSKEIGLSAAMLSSGCGYLAALMFGFPVITTEVYFFGLLAMAAAINSDFAAAKIVTAEGLPDKSKPGSPMPKIFRLFLIIGLIFAALFFSHRQIKMLQADHYYLAIQKARLGNQLFTAITLYDYIKETGVRQDVYAQLVGAIFAEWAWRLETRSEQYVVGLELENIYKNLKIKRFEDKVLKARIESAMFSLNRPQFFAEAQKTYQEVIAINPNIPQFHRELARLYIKNKRFAQAQAELAGELDLLPEKLTPDYGAYQKEAINMEKYRFHDLEGDLELASHDFVAARRNYEAAYGFNMNDLSLFKKIGAVCEAVKNYDCALKYYNRGKIRNPKDKDWDVLIKKVESL